MSRTSRSVPALAVAALLAGLALTGCSDAKSGAAAVVDGDRIDISTLNSRVEQAADARESVGAQPLSGVEATHEELLLLIQNEVVEEAARRAGIVVTATDIVNKKREWAQQNPGSSIEATLARAGVPASGVDDMVRRAILFDRITAANGGTPGTDAGEAVLSRVLVDTAQTMKITVNPRYGAWDPTKGDIGPTTYDWLTPDRSA